VSSVWMQWGCGGVGGNLPICPGTKLDCRNYVGNYNRLVSYALDNMMELKKYMDQRVAVHFSTLSD
jgi:hypothetical protein